MNHMRIAVTETYIHWEITYIHITCTIYLSTFHYKRAHSGRPFLSPGSRHLGLANWFPSWPPIGQDSPPPPSLASLGWLIEYSVPSPENKIFYTCTVYVPMWQSYILKGLSAKSDSTFANFLIFPLHSCLANFPIYEETFHNTQYLFISFQTGRTHRCSLNTAKLMYSYE